MKGLTRKIYDRHWKKHQHPFHMFNDKIASLIKPGMAVLEQGCGRTAPILSKMIDKGADLYGLDLVEFRGDHPALHLVNGDISSVPFEDEKFDLVYSRSVMEHVERPDLAFRETYRVLKPGGVWVFLTPNMWDYVSVISRMIPNNLHGKVVKYVQGRPEEDTFPTVYGCNSKSQVRKLCSDNRFEIKDFQYLGQHPAYLTFNPVLYYIGTLYEKLILSSDFFAGVRGWLLVTLAKK